MRLGILTTIACTWAVACGPQVGSDDDDAGTSADSGTSAGDGTIPPGSGGPPPPATSTSTTATDDTTDGADTSDDGSNFINDATGGTCIDAPPGTSFHCSACDVFAQDCPEGEKCMPWANDGGNAWNATRCSAIADAPGQLGDPCEVEGSSVSGIDTCDLGLMCWDVDAAGAGTCIALCSGSPEDPQCPEGHTCRISGEGVLALCLADCDPLLQDCPGSDETCVPLGGQFQCVVTDGEAMPGEGCASPLSCGAGAACLLANEVPDCPAFGCCSSFCNLTGMEPDAPCLPGQTCTPWYEAGRAPSGLEHVGVCSASPG